MEDKTMRLTNGFIASTLILMSVTVAGAQTQRTETTYQIARRAALAIQYPETEGTSVDMVATPLTPQARGKAEVKRSAGRTRLKLKIAGLINPQSIGEYYTTYVLWAIAPEGQADNLGELPVTAGSEREIEFTTPYQTFALIITAEPHGLVKLPGPAIVAENALRKDTKGAIAGSRIQYRGDSGSLYVVSGSERTAKAPDFTTPLAVLGARHSVEIARRADAARYAEAELRDAEVKLGTLEAVWPRERENDRRFTGEAHEVMRLAEQARAVAVERWQQAHLEAERRSADRTIARAQSEAERERDAAARAREAAERAKEDAATDRAALEQSRSELERARERVQQAQTEAERAKANEELARIQAESARVDANQARQERDAAQRRLFVSLSEILETRREARGLIVSLSDVLFDFNQASLKVGAREKLSKLAGILQAYSAPYRMEIEGHADAIGSDQYNLKLSEARAGSVRDYLVQAGIAGDRIVATRGLGKTRPVATNDTPEGRQMNRRVEIIIADDETGQQ